MASTNDMTLLPERFVGAAKQADWRAKVNIPPSSRPRAGTHSHRLKFCEEWRRSFSIESTTRYGSRLLMRNCAFGPGRHGMLRRRRRNPAVDHDGLARHEGRG